MPAPDDAVAILGTVERELTALAGMADRAAFADEIYGFHAQQAAEKCLKAWLALVGCPYPLTHDLTRLLGILRERGEQVERWQGLSALNPFAVDMRYSYSSADEPPIDRRMMLSQVRSLYEAVRAKVEGMP